MRSGRASNAFILDFGLHTAPRRIEGVKYFQEEQKHFSQRRKVEEGAKKQGCCSVRVFAP